MDPQLMQMLMAWGQGLRPPSIGNYGPNALMPQFAAAMQPGATFSPLMRLYGQGGPNPDIHAMFQRAPMAGQFGHAMNLANWSKPQGGGAKAGGGGVLGGLGAIGGKR